LDLAATLLSTGWASGVNAYLTVALLGILGRAGVGPVPDDLQSNPVIVVALALFAIEFVVDKVPWLDSTWDSVHTVVRPAVGSFVGLAFAGDAHVSNIDEIAGAGGSGATALASHAVKAGIRLGVNTSPEPVSNIVLSLAEDALVIVVAGFAINHPRLAAAIAAVLLAIGLCIVAVMWKAIRRALRRRRLRSGADPPDP
jgi:hypothetical protein